MYITVIEQTSGRKIIAVIDGDNYDFELLIDEDLLWTGTYYRKPFLIILLVL